MSDNGQKSSKVVSTISIDIMLDGTLSIRNLPPEYSQAMNAMQLATRTVVDFFMAKAAKGEFVEQKIFRPDQGAIKRITG